ncbi:MAG: hypothetical protein UDP16_03310 [Collinsella sp.]|nr:hypothetical protein [Collinsella sp.]
MACVELPKDATGLEIPLDTEVLYDMCGTKVSVKEFLYRTLVESHRTEWTIEAQYEGNFYNNSFKPKDMHLTPPDTWEKLEEDLQRITADPTEWFCMYAGRDKRDTGCHGSCCNCKFFKDNMPCERQAVLDIVFRIRKLRGED